MSRMAELLPDSYAINKLVRRNNPETSYIAAESVVSKLTHIQEQVLVFIKNCSNGATDLDVSRHFDDDRSTYRSRRAELVAQGRIRNSGRKKMQDGTSRTVWEYVSG